MQNRRERMLRAVLSASVTTLATAAAHDLGGGHFPHPVLLTLVFLMAVPFCFLVGGRRVTAASLAASVAATQILLHGAFSIVAPSLDHSVLAGAAGRAGHAHHASAAALQESVRGALAVGPVEPAGTGDVAAGGGPMLVMHLLAGLAALAALTAGTEAQRRLADAVLLATAQRLAAVRHWLHRHRTATRLAGWCARALAPLTAARAAQLALADGSPATGPDPRGSAGRTVRHLVSLYLAPVRVLRGPPAPLPHPA
ncbi:hypothetical protein [Zhihengliuella sp.]|uniref:hypothetical protein n=1 Tax=Zhihengliuella sp. TaxID=1954483 RepID=UPI0028112CB1|nr:hypothetical protein [Zhihengliuella sp.]